MPTRDEATPHPGEHPRVRPAAPRDDPEEQVARPSADRWAAIVADQVARGADPATIRLIDARSVTWRTGSLGRSGHRATQALVPGLIVRVEVAGHTREYRFGSNDIPVLTDPGPEEES